MVDQAYDEAKQQQADPYMQETMDAMTTSSLSSASLSSAQTAAAWGLEEGPSALGSSAGALFSSVSDLLAKGKRPDLCVRDEREAGVGERQAERVG